MDTNFAETLFAEVGAIDSTDSDLSAYVDSIGQMFKEVEQYARESDAGLAPWQTILDPEAALNEASLLWLAQLAGVRIPVGTPEGGMTELIMLAEARRRGTLAYMVEIAQRQLTGDKFVFVQERDGSAYRLSFVTRTAETPEPDAVLAALLSVKPAGIVLDYAVSDGVTWDEPVHAWNAAGAVEWDETATVTP